MVKLVIAIGVAALIAAIAYTFFGERKSNKQERFQQAFETDEMLQRHNEIFSEEKIVKVRDGVYVAIGYSIANMIMLEGSDGIIIVDTTESSLVAMEVYEKFIKLSQKPLKGIILTHFHTDHVNGVSAILDAINYNVNVYTHSSTASEIKKFMASSDIGFKRASRQFGIYLERNSERKNAGIGPKLQFSQDSKFNPIEATHTFDDEAIYQLAGITFHLIHTPGETDDQISVWIPDWKVLLPADNIYEAFPNLYAIRGSPPRDSSSWFRSLDKIRRLRAEHLVPSHTRPVSGEEKIYDIITHYRDAIQYVNDQTIRLMNLGLPVDEIVEQVRLPASLSRHPYLQEFYGRVTWSVRAVYSSQLGWFDGNPVNLQPLSNKKRAKRVVELLNTNFPSQYSGVERLLSKAREHLKLSWDEMNKNGNILVEELQWALELSSDALEVITDASSQLYEEAKQLKVEVLQALGTSSVSSNARNYYLTCAKELERDLVIIMNPAIRYAIMRSLKVKDIMSILPQRFMAENCDDKLTLTIVFEFPDVNETHSYTMRHCILEYNTEPDVIPKEFDTKLTMTSSVWKDIITKEKSAVTSYATGDMVVEGSMLSFKRFVDLLQSSAQ